MDVDDEEAATSLNKKAVNKSERIIAKSASSGDE